MDFNVNELERHTTWKPNKNQKLRNGFVLQILVQLQSVITEQGSKWYMRSTEYPTGYPRFVLRSARG
jgi:hypothetical protein